MPRRARLIGTALAAVAVLSACSATTGNPTDRAGAGSRPASGSSSASTAHALPASTPRAAEVAAAPAQTTTPPPPKPRPDPCAGNRSAQLVRVSLSRQHLWMCARTALVYSTPITSGMSGPDTSTPTGNYRIQGRDRNSVLTLNTGKQYHVKYWIPFDAPLFGFHDASWQTFPFGSARYKTAGSHGCVHMPLTAIAFLYRWVHVGADVRIHD